MSSSKKTNQSMNSLKLCFLPLLALICFSSTWLYAQDTPEANKMTEPRLTCYVGCEEIASPAYRAICSRNRIIQFVKSEMEQVEIEQKQFNADLTLYFSLNEKGEVTTVDIANAPEGEWRTALQKAALKLPKMFPPEKNDAAVTTTLAVTIEVKDGKIVSNPNYEEAIAKESPNFTGQLDEMPRFSGCENKKPKKRKSCADLEMLKFIYKNMKYPQEARKARIQGRVMIRFIVDEQGNVIMPEIFQGIGGGCGPAALSIFTKMPKWIPAMKDGKPVPSIFNCPVIFKLE